MLEQISGFLQKIGEFFTTAWEIITGFFEDIAYVVKMLGNFITNIPSYFGWLPSSIVILLGTAFTVVIALKIIGKD